MKNNLQITLRDITPEDEAFLCSVYASTRSDEMALVDWNDSQKKAFLDMQFTAQSRYYRENYPDAAFQIIVASGRQVGRLYVEQWVEEIRIIDISLLPEFRPY
jgi:hypothetical protein